MHFLVTKKGISFKLRIKNEWMEYSLINSTPGSIRTGNKAKSKEKYESFGNMKDGFVC